MKTTNLKSSEVLEVLTNFKFWLETESGHDADVAHLPEYAIEEYVKLYRKTEKLNEIISDIRELVDSVDKNSHEDITVSDRVVGLVEQYAQLK